jgi:hypothetical protein
MPYDSVLITLHRLGFSKEMVVVTISALPIAGLRLAIPFALGLIPSQVYPQTIPWQQALPLAITGNLLPVPLLLLFFGVISRCLSRIGVFWRWFQCLEERGPASREGC